jgi:hypothetical protein
MLFRCRPPTGHFLCLIMGCLLWVPPAEAWNRAGHMVSGAIAYTLLKRADPNALAHWTAVLKQHPHFESRWQPQLEGVVVEEHDQCLFMLAARWPDDIRGDPDYDRPDWHFINYSFKPAGQPESVTTVGPADENIVMAFRANLSLLKQEAPAGQQAVALCWVLHLVGDVHQPLHTTKLFTTDFAAPEGDRGGTRFYIRATPASEAISLHKFWDDLILGSEEFQSVRNTAVKIRRMYPRGMLSELATTPTQSDFRVWAEAESFFLAKTKVYLDGRLAGSPQRDDAPALPADYARSVKPVAERRLALAAYRLADLLRR